MTKKSLVASAALVVVIGLFGSKPGLAGQNLGTVNQVIIGGSIAYISLVNQSGLPGCAGHNRYVVDLVSPTGRAMYLMALSAKLTGTPLLVIGTGACSLLPGDAEDVANTALL